MSHLSARKRARLPKRAFAYVDSKGRKRLPIHDEAHVRNALARFNQVTFEDEAARERARQRLLVAAKKYGIVPIGFMAGQLRSQMSEATAGRLVIETGAGGHAGRVRAAAAHGAARPHPVGSALVRFGRDLSRRRRAADRAALTRRRPRRDAARATGPPDDRPRARPRRPGRPRSGQDRHGCGQADGRERAASRPGRRSGQRAADAANGACDLPPDRHGGVDQPASATGRSVRRPPGRRPRHHPGRRAPGRGP